jgi:hypothetical protein
MNEFISKGTGVLALAVGISSLLALAALILFFVGLFQGIPSLSPLGALNDSLNALTSLLSAALATALYPALKRLIPRGSLLLLLCVWLGAGAVSYGSWLIINGRSDLELSSYYYFVGNGLIGIWAWALNRSARQQGVWRPGLAQLGMIASGFMMVGLLGLYGILSGFDGSGYSPLLLLSGISYLGIGFLYPAWGIQLARWILSIDHAMQRS